VLQSLYNLSDEQIEYQVRDRLSFTRFVGLGFENGIPDGTTLWLFREKLAKAGLIDKLFGRFGRHLEAKGYIARGGRWSMRRSCRCRDSATAETRTSRSRLAPRPRTGRSVRRRTGRRTRMRAGRRSMGAACSLQEPCERRCPAQADPQLRGRRCKRARQPEVRRASDPGAIHRGTSTPTVPTARPRRSGSLGRGASGAAFTNAGVAVVR
jgi:Transposase domain (DUF772)